jgi:hypothetical protein
MEMMEMVEITRERRGSLDHTWFRLGCVWVVGGPVGGRELGNVNVC